MGGYSASSWGYTGESSRSWMTSHEVPANNNPEFTSFGTDNPSSHAYGSWSGSTQSSDQALWHSQRQDVSFGPLDYPSEDQASAHLPHHSMHMDTYNSFQGDIVPSHFIEQTGALPSQFHSSYSSLSNAVPSYSQSQGSLEMDAGSAGPPTLHFQTAQYSSGSSSSNSQLNVQTPSFYHNQQLDPTGMRFFSSDLSSASTSASLYTPDSDAGLQVPLNDSTFQSNPSPSSSSVYYENSQTEKNEKICSICKATSTSKWNKQKQWCSACYQYISKHGKSRPAKFIKSYNNRNSLEKAECRKCGTEKTCRWY
ncbi:hypothetical protein CVT24_012156 [Panaeolus cyanescens]|uniref:GATA-type domain-containing protein n=1 Tax=Panaeolus cyanescens TaxID=181874 RepID=A0A409YIZ4_9AGAR|nr:hypothetical protein CVT24_012156 [Panaeolus cyanescens]